LAWQALGLTLLTDNDSIEEGISALLRAIELNPDDGWALIALANAFWKLKMYDEAKEKYKDAIAIFPEYPKFRKWYAEFLSSINEEKTEGGEKIGDTP